MRFPRVFRALSLILLLAQSLAAAPGDLDSSFGSGGKVTTAIGGTSFGNGYDSVDAMAVQPDGKIVAAGSTNDDGVRKFAVARYLPDGTLDTSFGGVGVVKTGFIGGAASGYAVCLQHDGRIIVGGSANGAFALARYTSAGVLDTSFGSGTGMVTTTGFHFPSSNDAGIYSMAVQSDGKIVAAGQSRDGNNRHWIAVTRYLENGTLDTTFDNDGRAISAFGHGGTFGRAVAIQNDGAIVVAGYGWNGLSGYNDDVVVVRFTSSGILDTSFNGGVVNRDLIMNGGDRGLGIALQNDGKITIACDVSSYALGLLRLLPTGLLDTSFNGTGMVVTPVPAGNAVATCVQIQADGKILAGGRGINGGQNDFVLARYSAGGLLDTGFASGGIRLLDFGGYDSAAAMALQGDGKVLLAGVAMTSNGDFALARFEGGPDTDADADGLLDQWEYNHWRTTAGHGPQDDHDKDGYGELLEEALGLNPNFPDAGGHPSVTHEGGHLTMTIHKQPGVTYVVQTAGTLISGQPDSFSSASTTVLIDSTTTMKVRDSVLASGGTRRFIRAQVTAAP